MTGLFLSLRLQLAGQKPEPGACSCPTTSAAHSKWQLAIQAQPGPCTWILAPLPCSTLPLDQEASLSRHFPRQHPTGGRVRSLEVDCRLPVIRPTCQRCCSGELDNLAQVGQGCLV